MTLFNTLKRSKKETAVGYLLDENATGKKKSFWSEYGYLLLCIGLPILLFLALYFARGHYPAGDGTVLVLDLTAQYVWFFEALRDAVLGDGSILYSFSRALGGEFVGIYAYYIASPLSYIVCLFPKDRMLEALLCIFVIKAGISGGTFGFYMHKTMKERNKLSIVIFSVCYALCAYAVVQQHNSMWIDALMWLPLLTYGIEQLIQKGKFKLYTIILALTLFSNFYIGYMVCFYCVFYFFLYYFAHNEEGKNNLLGEKLHFIKSLLRIGFFSLLAVGMCAVILLGAYYSLNFGKTTFSNTTYVWTTNFDILDFLYKLLPGSYDTVRPEGLPFVYCGLLTLLFIPAYFLSKKHTVREKIFAGIFIFIFVASFTVTAVDLIWHGFQRPNWLNYRYSFMLSFYLCVLACRAFADFKNVSLKVLMGCGGLIALLCVILQKYTDGAYVTPHDYTCIWITLIFVFMYLATLALMRTAKNPRSIAVVLVSIVCAEVFLNGLFNMISLDEDVVYSHYSYYNDFLDSTRPIADEVKERDPSFYRMEKTSWRAINDNMGVGIRGLTGSTSTLNKETIQFLQKMGYASKSHWSKYLGGTPVNDSLLGIKYVISKNSVYENYYDVFATDPEHGYTAYRNPYALSIGYGVSDQILDFPLGFTNEVVEDAVTDEEKKDVIGDFVRKLKSYLNDLFDIDETINSSEYIDEYYNPFERVNAMIGYMLGQKTPYNVYHSLRVSETLTNGNLTVNKSTRHIYYKPVDENKDATLIYYVDAIEDGEIYFYIPTIYPSEVKLHLTDLAEGKRKDMGTCNGNETNRIISLGYHEAGTRLKLELTLKGPYLYILKNQKLFYFIDWETFDTAFTELAKDQFNVTSYTEDSLEGTFKASYEHELMMTTIAYDKGWKVYVDGKEVETIKALGSLVSFYVDGEAGETHDIRLVYRPNVIVIGAIVSLTSLGIFLLIVLIDVTVGRRRRRRKEQRMRNTSYEATETVLPVVGASDADGVMIDETKRRPLPDSFRKRKTFSSKGVAKEYVSLYQRKAGTLGKRHRRR